MAAEYDIFISHAWADGDRPQQIADALTRAGLRVWFDAAEISDFASITGAATEGLGKSKALLAYCSKMYPFRRACQWELTTAFLAAQTEGDPRRRVLVISPEEKADHIHPIELRDAKFRNVPNNDEEALEELVQSIVKRVATLDAPLADIHPIAPPPWHGIKPTRYEHFVGRFQEMWAIHSLLHEATVVQITGASGQDIAQITGLGGIGKSLLAREYALRFGGAYPGGVFWVSAYGNDDAKGGLSDEGREAERNGQLRQFAQDFGIDVASKSAEDIRSSLTHEIAKRGQPCLWIVDDLPLDLNAKAFHDWCAPHPLARTLITTRTREYGALAKAIDLSVLVPEEAYQLLTSRRAPGGEAERQQAQLLAERLGRHALALDVTASALVSYSGAEPYRQFLTELGGRDEDALELAKDLADVLPNGHEKSIAQTMLRSIRNLGPEGLDFLRLASVLAVAPIPGLLVSEVFEAVDKLSHERAEWRAMLAVKQVTSASLAEVAGEKQDARSVHTLVSRAVHFHEKTAPERTEALRAAAIEALTSEIRLHKQIELHIAHARQIVGIPASVSEASLVFWVARYDYEIGLYASARTLHQRALDFRRNVLGPEHTETTTSMDNLAGALQALGDLAGACKLHEEALQICRRVLGSDHPHTLLSMTNLAATLLELGDLVAARKQLEETLLTQIRVLGPVHPDTVASMSNLAANLLALSDVDGALNLQKKVLEIHLEMVGPQDPRTLIAMNNVATGLLAQKRFTEARELLEVTLALRRRVLGPEHPHTLQSMSNLAGTLVELGDLAPARVLLEMTLDSRRRVLGPEHPSTSASAWWLYVALEAL